MLGENPLIQFIPFRFLGRFVKSLAALTLAIAFLAVGCSRNETAAVDLDSVKITAGEATFENYRDKKVLIDVPAGNRNPRISWQTLYDMMPGEEPVAGRQKSDEEGNETVLKSLAGVVKKFVGGKSTKKNFANWKDDPAALRAELDRRFTKQFRSIIKQKRLKDELIAAGKAHDVDPINVLACILGENIFNVTGFDDAGTYAIRAQMMANKWALQFRSNEIELPVLLKRPEFSDCDAKVRAGGSHAQYWDCVGAVWAKKFLGKNVDGVKYPANGFKWTFFNPIGTGYSYGLGQLDPIRALMVTDQVNKKSGFRLLSVERPEEIYEDIIEPKTTIHYVAANVRLMIERYASGAGFDISHNPGVIASLYNLGGEGARADELYKKNLVSLKQGTVILPMENYYGFYMNEKEALMREAFARWGL